MAGTAAGEWREGNIYSIKCFGFLLDTCRWCPGHCPNSYCCIKINPECFHKPTVLQALSQQYKVGAPISKNLPSLSNHLWISFSYLFPKAEQLLSPQHFHPVHVCCLLSVWLEANTPYLKNYQICRGHAKNRRIPDIYKKPIILCLSGFFGPRLRVTSTDQAHYPCNLSFIYEFPF